MLPHESQHARPPCPSPTPGVHSNSRPYILVSWLCPTLFYPISYSPPGPSVHGILQARILERVTISFSRGSSMTQVKHTSPALWADTLPSEPPGLILWYNVYLKYMYFFGRNNAKAETPVLWPHHAKSWLIGKESDAGKDWGQEEKGMTEDEMAGWYHRLDGRESEWTPGVGDGQGGLACCDSWGRKESDTTERLIWSDLIWCLGEGLPKRQAV